MALSFSNEALNVMWDAFGTLMPNGRLKFRTGDPPAATTDASTGTLLADITLPASPMAAASGGTKLKSGTWEDPSADASGDIGHFELLAADNTLVHLRGTVTATGNGGNLTVNAIAVVAGQRFAITGFTLG